MLISDIAKELNEKSKNYKIRKLHDIRKKIKGLKNRTRGYIFDAQSISDNNGFAFHYGGRQELQFNIGMEEENKFRYGLAFSMQLSRNHTSLDILKPSIKRFNEMVYNKPHLFNNYIMWHYYKESGKQKRSANAPVNIINDDLFKEGNFIFIGKLVKETEINYDEILKTFDDLLDIYIEVETHPNSAKANIGNFDFGKSRKGGTFPKTRAPYRIQHEISPQLRHSDLQESLISYLKKTYPDAKVSAENDTYNNGSIDVVLKKDGKFFFYEVKTANSAGDCIRQAMGQLFEYAYFGCIKLPEEIIVAGEYEIETHERDYLSFLNKEFAIPISYIKIPETCL